MNKPRAYHDLEQSVQEDAELKRLRLFMDKLEQIQRDVNDLMNAMDRVYMDKTTKGQNFQDFLIKNKDN